MEEITKKVYEEIQDDIVEINEQLEKYSGSKVLWDSLNLKYSIMLPKIASHFSDPSASISSGMNYEYNSLLRQFKEVILAYLALSHVEEQLNESINNDTYELMNKELESKEDIRINELIEESKLYMRSDESSKKQIALEKIWDAFERLKTIYGENHNKKESVQKLIDNISHGTDSNKKMFNDEFNELTSIGNNYQIRHFEKDKHPVPSDGFREYLYFRILSLISYCIQEYKK